MLFNCSGLLSSIHMVGTVVGTHFSVSGDELFVEMFFYSLYALLFFLRSFPLTVSYKCFGELWVFKNLPSCNTLLSFSVFFFWYSTFLLCLFSAAKQQAQKSLSFRAKGLQGLDVAKGYMEWIIPIRKLVCWLREGSWGGREEKKKIYLKLLFPIKSLLVWTADVCGNSLNSLS